MTGDDNLSAALEYAYRRRDRTGPMAETHRRIIAAMVAQQVADRENKKLN